MGVNEYALEALVQDRLAELRREAAAVRLARASSVQSP